MTVRNPGPALSREHTDSYEAAGPGGLAAAKSEGMQAARCTVAGVTTTPAAAPGRPADLIRRHFSPAAPDQLWVADFTHMLTWPCMVYVAFVIHARSRRVPGLTRRPVDQDGETVQ